MEEKLTQNDVSESREKGLAQFAAIPKGAPDKGKPNSAAEDPGAHEKKPDCMGFGEATSNARG